MPEPRTIRVLNLGAGVQSTTVYLLAMRQDEPEHVPPIDFAVFADTQEEPRAVYEHVEWLKSLGGPPILTDTAGKLGDELISGFERPGRLAWKQIPAYTSDMPGVEQGKAQRQCTGHYKINVVERVIRRKILGLSFKQHVPKDTLVLQYMGLSYDEPRRIIKVQDRFRKIQRMEPRFPLFDLQWTRADCVSYLKEVVPDRAVPRSACVFCPYKTNAEWRKLRDEDPESWRRAVQVDAALRQPGAACAQRLEKQLYVHRSCLPLDKAPIDRAESNQEQYLFGFAQECEGMCGL